MNRVQPGRPTGGQFAQTPRAASEVDDLPRDASGFDTTGLPDGIYTVNEMTDAMVFEGYDRGAVIDALNEMPTATATDAAGRTVPTLTEQQVADLGVRLDAAAAGLPTDKAFLHAVWTARSSLETQERVRSPEWRTGMTIVEHSEGTYRVYSSDAWDKPTEAPMLPWHPPTGTKFATVGLDGKLAHAARSYDGLTVADKVNLRETSFSDAGERTVDDLIDVPDHFEDSGGVVGMSIAVTQQPDGTIITSWAEGEDATEVFHETPEQPSDYSCRAVGRVSITTPDGKTQHLTGRVGDYEDNELLAAAMHAEGIRLAEAHATEPGSV